jgi:DNA-directed RNA polymerase specialized sigma24 family protein
MEAQWGKPIPGSASGYDETAWGGLYELRECVRLYLLRLNADENDLEDTIQETFLRAARYRQRREVRHLRPWVLRIARNVLVDGRRRRRRAGVPLASGDPAELERGAETPAIGGVRIAGVWCEPEAAHELVRIGLTRLRRADQALLAGHYLSGGEAASPTTGRVLHHPSKTRLYRARQKLRAVLCHEVDRRDRLGVAS